MQLIENIKTFTVQILHHIQKSKCVPVATEDAGFTHTTEIQANMAASHELPKRLHIYVSTRPPNQHNNSSAGLQGTQLPPVITRRMPQEDRGIPARCTDLVTRRGQRRYTAHDQGAC